MISIDVEGFRFFFRGPCVRDELDLKLMATQYLLQTASMSDVEAVAYLRKPVEAMGGITIAGYFFARLRPLGIPMTIEQFNEPNVLFSLLLKSSADEEKRDGGTIIKMITSVADLPPRTRSGNRTPIASSGNEIADMLQSCYGSFGFSDARELMAELTGQELQAFSWRSAEAAVPEAERKQAYHMRELEQDQQRKEALLARTRANAMRMRDKVNGKKS